MAKSRRSSEAERKQYLESDQTPDAEQEEQEAEESAAQKTRKIDAVRQVLEEDPDMKPAKGVRIIKERFGITMSPSHFSASKSQIRAREKEHGDGRPGGPDPANYEPTLSHLRAIKDGVKGLAESEAFRALQDEPESVEEWLRVVAALAALAERVGGLAQLEKCMAALLEIRDNK
jgi:hypothetical protein